MTANDAGSTDTNLAYVIVRDFTVNLNFPEINKGDVNWPSIYTKAMRLIDADLRREVWDDIRVPSTALKTGASAPDFAQLQDNGSGSIGVFTWMFDGNSTLEQVFFNVQIPHGWLQGGDIEPHVHWTPTADPGGALNVVWQLEYVWVNQLGAIGNTTIIEAIIGIDSGDEMDHLRSDFANIDGTGKTFSSMLMCRLFRDPAHGSDNYTNDAAFLEFDFHFKKTVLGSLNEDPI